MTTPAQTPDEDRRRRRRLLALLSAGLVVGVGVLSTLASWNTEQFVDSLPGTTVGPTSATGSATASAGRNPSASGSATGAPEPTAPVVTPTPTPGPTPSPTPSAPPAGTFVLVGSVDGTTFTDHSTASRSAILSFSERASRLSPGDTVGAPFALRLSDVGAGVGPVTLVVTDTGTGADLTFGMFTTASFGCRAGTSTTGTLIPAGTPLGGTVTSTPTAMPMPSEDTAGDPLYLCVKVTAGTGLVPGSRHSAAWYFDAAAG